MKKANNSLNIIWIVFLILGIVFVGIAVMIHINDSNFKKNAMKTEATIIDIREYTDYDDEIEHDVFIEYRVQGNVYNKELDYYSSSMRIGGSVTIYYDPKNPNDFVSEGASIGIIACSIIGAIFAIIGSVLVGSSILKKSKKNKVLKYNTIIQANINSFDLNTSLVVNGRHPYVLRASAISPYDGLIYNFESDSIMTDLTPVFEAYKITKVPVYVNPQNYKEYYIDIDSFKIYIGN